MSKTILDLTGVNKKQGLIGIEIEVEGVSLPNSDNIKNENFFSKWLITQDGSLRGEAWEYVLREPLDYSNTVNALNLLEEQYVKCKSTINDSVRAGIHVHINVQDLTLKQLYTMFTVYYCLENILVDWCGKDRVGNHFCLRACDAEYILFAIQRAFQQDGKAAELAGDNIRYASMNVASVLKYGSVEFRSLRSTRDWSRLLTWVKALTYIKEASKLFEDPRSVIEYISVHSSISFAKTVLKDVFCNFETNNLDSLIYEGVRNIQAVAFSLDFNKAEIQQLRRDSSPSYKSEAYKFALTNWRKYQDKDGKAEIPLEEALSALSPIPTYKEAAQGGNRPFEELRVNLEEPAQEDDLEWFGRGARRRPIFTPQVQPRSRQDEAVALPPRGLGDFWANQFIIPTRPIVAEITAEEAELRRLQREN